MPCVTLISYIELLMNQGMPSLSHYTSVRETHVFRELRPMRRRDSGVNTLNNYLLYSVHDLCRSVYVTSSGRASRARKNPRSVRHSRMVTVWRLTVTSVMKIWSATGDRAIQYAAPRRGCAAAVADGGSLQESSSSWGVEGGGGRAPFGSAGAVAAGCVCVRLSRSGGVWASASSGE